MARAPSNPLPVAPPLEDGNTDESPDPSLRATAADEPASAPERHVPAPTPLGRGPLSSYREAPPPIQPGWHPLTLVGLAVGAAVVTLAVAWVVIKPSQPKPPSLAPPRAQVAPGPARRAADTVTPKTSHPGATAPSTSGALKPDRTAATAPALEAATPPTAATPKPERTGEPTRSAVAPKSPHSASRAKSMPSAKISRATVAKELANYRAKAQTKLSGDAREKFLNVLVAAEQQLSKTSPETVLDDLRAAAHDYGL